MLAITFRVRVTLFHGGVIVRLGGILRLQSSKLALLVLHLLFQLLELLTPKLSRCGLAFRGAFVATTLFLASSAGLTDCRLLFLWEVLPLLVSVPAVLPLARTCDVQGCNPHLHVCRVHSLFYKVLVKRDTTGKIRAEKLIRDDSALNRIKGVGLDPRVQVTNLGTRINASISVRNEALKDLVLFEMQKSILLKSPVALSP